MGNTILVTVSDDRFGRKNGLYRETQNKLCNLLFNQDFGIKSGIHNVIDFCDKTNFYKDNYQLLRHADAAKNGRAYKPWVISDSLNNINEGDFLIYSDCSPEMWSPEIDLKKYDLNILKELCASNNGILTAFVKWDNRKIQPGMLGIHTHENFTTNLCMDTIGLRRFEKSFMHASGMVVLQKTPSTIEFVKTWLHYNLIDKCCALGRADVENDYSFWANESHLKMGHRHDQSISGLLINAMGNKLVDLPIPGDDNLHSYNFLNFCRPNVNYNFINPNINPETKRRIKKGDKIMNSAGQYLTVFEIRAGNDYERLIVGLHPESCYETTENLITLI